MFINRIGQYLLIAISILAATASNAAMMRYTFEGNITLEKLGGSLFEPPIDQSLYQNLNFSVNIDANTDNINSKKLAGYGTNYYVNGTNASFDINQLGSIDLINPLVSSIPGVFVTGFTWGQVGTSQRGSAFFYGTYSFLTKEILNDDVYLRTDWFNNPILIYSGDTFRISRFSNVNYSVSAIPLPSTLILFLSGLGILVKLSNKKYNK